MRKKLLIALSVLIFLIIALVVAEFVLTWQAESQLASIIQKKLNLSRPPEVKIIAHPLLFRLYQGQIDYIQIDAADVPHDQFKADRIVVIIKNLQFDTSLLLSQRELTVRKVDQGLIKVVISEAEVNKYVQQILPGSRIELEKGKVRYSGKIRYSGQELNLNLFGTVRVDSVNNAISFFPDRRGLERLPVSSEVRDHLASELATQVKLPDLPISLRLVGVRVEPGRMTIEGQISNFALFERRS